MSHEQDSPICGEHSSRVKTDLGLSQFPCQACGVHLPPPFPGLILQVDPHLSWPHFSLGLTRGVVAAAVPCTGTEIHCDCRVRTRNATQADTLRHRLDRAGQGWAGQGWAGQAVSLCVSIERPHCSLSFFCLWVQALHPLSFTASAVSCVSSCPELWICQCPVGGCTYHLLFVRTIHLHSVSPIPLSSLCLIKHQAKLFSNLSNPILIPWHSGRLEALPCRLSLTYIPLSNTPNISNITG